jgi:DNA-binding response OmpR family regulator
MKRRSDRPDTPPEQALRILIAEDIGTSRQLLASLLRYVAQVEIHEVNDGAAVAEMHYQVQPHVTFLDIGLPNKSGMDVLRDMRAKDDKSFIVIVSANSNVETITEAVALRVDGFVVKPYSPKRIVEALDRYRARATADAPLQERD